MNRFGSKVTPPLLDYIVMVDKVECNKINSDNDEHHNDNDDDDYNDNDDDDHDGNDYDDNDDDV